MCVLPVAQFISVYACCCCSFHIGFCNTASCSVQVVGLGICSVFELIKEAHKFHPGLCVKALAALKKVLEGQDPEALRLESKESLGM